jgi:ankyrin repeat protein
MTNFFSRTILILFSLFGVILSAFAKMAPASPLINRIPSDSFLIVSMNADHILQKSNLLQNRIWQPILDHWRLANPQAQVTLDDLNRSGFNLKSPLRFFVRLQGNPLPTPVWGMVASVENGKKVDARLSEVAESFALQVKGGKSLRLGNEKIPFEIGRRGKWAYAIGMVPNPRNPPTTNYELQIDQLVQEFFRRPKNTTFPESLKKYFATEADASLYLDGTGISRLVEDFFVPDNFRNFLPMFDYFTHRPLGVHFNSNPGKLDFSLVDYSSNLDEDGTQDESNSSSQRVNFLPKVPGDVAVIGKVSFPHSSFQKSALQVLDSILNFISGGTFDSSKSLPGFDASIPELLDGLRGNFVFAGGNLQTKNQLPQDTESSAFDRYASSFLLGAEIQNSLSVKQLLAGIRSSSVLMSLMNTNGIRLIEKEKILWVTTDHYRKELESGRTIYKLPESRKRKVQAYPFSMDFDIATFTRTARQDNILSFGENQKLQIMDQFSNFHLFTKPNSIHGEFKLRNKKIQGLEVIVNVLGQEIIDRKNDTLYQAIALNDFEALADAVSQGALINANDGFGHTPIHYSAYKGNTRFVDYLLRNGGNPNVRGRHMSSPLHSAAWGRNMEVFELLLEDGADVDARTDEGETPGMTAALRGEKEMLEILFALSADPHAKDIHGSNMLDLAAAGGHKEIVQLLSEMGVDKNHPLHVAAGLGDLKRVKLLLQNGYEVNQKDAFGATPLLISVVSGKTDVVEFLLSAGADPLLQAKDGYTLMHAADFSGMKEMVRLGLSFGLEVNPRYGSYGITPVDVAEDEKEALPYLRSLGGRASWELAPVIK